MEKSPNVIPKYCHKVANMPVECERVSYKHVCSDLVYFSDKFSLQIIQLVVEHP